MQGSRPDLVAEAGVAVFVRSEKDEPDVNRIQRNRESGQDLAEYALILPIVLLLIMGIIEVAVILFDYNAIANAAREGARVGIIQASTDQDIRDAAKNHALGLGLTDGDITINTPTLNTIQVEVQYDARLITGALLAALGGNDTISLRAVATMRKE